MNQMGYIEEILMQFNMDGCKPVRTLFDVNSKLLKLPDKEVVNVQKEIKGVLHKAGIRFLMYKMMVTRANITFVVDTMSQFKLNAGLPQSGREMDYEVFEGHFGLQIMPKK